MNKLKNTKKGILILSVFLIFLIIGSASAAEDSDEISNETILTSTMDVDTVSTPVDKVNEEVSTAETTDGLGSSDTENILKEDSDDDYTQLKNELNKLKNNTQITLQKDYTINSPTYTKITVSYLGTNGVLYTPGQNSNTIFFINSADNITIDGNGHSISANVNKPSDNVALFKFYKCSNVTVKNINFINYNTEPFYWAWSPYFKIINCTFQNYTGLNRNIEVYDLSSHGYVYNCTFINGSAANGVGLFSRGHGPSGFLIDGVWVLPTINLTVSNCHFENLKSHTTGCAIELNCGYSLIENNTFINCQVSTNHGGAINIYTTGGFSTVKNCTFINNSAVQGNGGAIMLEKVDSKNVTIINCSFINNTAKRGGGAIFFNAADSKIINCTFEGNNASEGGAVKFQGKNGYMGFCTYINNTATTDGGALCANAEGSTVENCTFTNCSSPKDISGFYAHGSYSINFIGLQFPVLYLTNGNATYSVSDGYGTNVERPAAWRDDAKFLNQFLDTRSGKATIYPSGI